MAAPPGGRKQQYFIPGDGIAREVIQADVCKYLDNDATIKPGNFNGRDGYFIYAYRNFTNEMVADLRSDSAKWLREKEEKSRIQRSRQAGNRTAPSGKTSRHGAAGVAPNSYPEPRYTDSDTYEMSGQRIQARRDEFSDTPGPQGYSQGRAPPGPPGSYNDPHQAQYDSRYVTQSPPQPGYGSQASYTDSGYQSMQDVQYGQQRSGILQQGYPQGYQTQGNQPQNEQQYPMRGYETTQQSSGRPYPPGYPAGQQIARDYPYNNRPDQNYDPNYDPRQEPNYDPRYGQNPNDSGQTAAYDPRQAAGYDPRQTQNFDPRQEQGYNARQSPNYNLPRPDRYDQTMETRPETRAEQSVAPRTGSGYDQPTVKRAKGDPSGKYKR